MSETLLQKLEVLLNQTLRLITGAVTTTPIESMLLFIIMKPFGAVFEEKAILLYKKLMQTNFWSDYHFTPMQVKSQNDFIQSIRERVSKLDMDISLLKIK